MTKHPASKTDSPPQAPSTAKVNITLHGRDYIVACGAGEEKKLAELVKLVDGKLADIAAKNATTGASETRLFMLTCLLLADELIETRKLAAENRKADEALMVAAVDHLRERVVSIASQIGK
jgi:cell division protein ZapA